MIMNGYVYGLSAMVLLRGGLILTLNAPTVGNNVTDIDANGEHRKLYGRVLRSSIICLLVQGWEVGLIHPVVEDRQRFRDLAERIVVGGKGLDPVVLQPSPRDIEVGGGGLTALNAGQELFPQPQLEQCVSDKGVESIGCSS